MEDLRDLLNEKGERLLDGHGIDEVNITASNIQNLSIDEVYKIETLIKLYKRFGTSMELDAFLAKADKECDCEEVPDMEEMKHEVLENFGFSYYGSIGDDGKLEMIADIFNEKTIDDIENFLKED